MKSTLFPWKISQIDLFVCYHSLSFFRKQINVRVEHSFRLKFIESEKKNFYFARAILSLIKLRMKYRECRFHFFFVSCCFARFKLNEVIEERPNKTKHYDGREKLKIIFRLYIYIFILEYCVHVSITTLCTLLQLLRKEKFSV
jgi:hypothetical protein